MDDASVRMQVNTSESDAAAESANANAAESISAVAAESINAVAAAKPGDESGRVEPRKSAMPPARAGGIGELDVPDALQPLGEHERPKPLLVAVVVATALAIGVCISVATVHDLASHGGSLPGGLFLAGALFLLAWGMYQRRYWAVLGFEALLAFQIIVTSLALIVAETLLAAGLCVLSIGLAGWLFWKLVRVMGRIQAGEREVDEILG
jgi:hypothetical protein